MKSNTSKWHICAYATLENKCQPFCNFLILELVLSVAINTLSYCKLVKDLVEYSESKDGYFDSFFYSVLSR